MTLPKGIELQAVNSDNEVMPQLGLMLLSKMPGY